MDGEHVLRVAMWSPPRARSTMMMRVFEAIGCAVYDEPFYPYWLEALGKTDDPGYAETMAAHQTDWREIVKLILGPVPEGKRVYYQKHMAIHMLDDVDLSWMSGMRNCFLIRSPSEVIQSMSEFREISAEMVGIPQLRRIFTLARELCGEIPPVIDANDVLKDPRGVLGAFCERVGIDFPDGPITWAPGKHPYDGAWADAWYQKVYQTTCLGPYKPKATEVRPEHREVEAQCLEVYREIAQHKICP